ncbi:helix-turn-helix transcriptional regulator [Candidatus Bathyarchaeota archaeon]|nr:helix-turn-helix transcriptional regulator [Candidatus Bathyarchaeota archaeon]
MAYERLIKKITVENLWLYILSLLKDKPKYGYEIRKLIQERYGFKPGTVTAYIVLYRLVKEGYISLKEEKKEGKGPARKYYEITEEGRMLLAKGERFLEETLKKIRS